MPGPRVGPREFSGRWPDYSQDRFEIIEFRARISLRIAAPGPSEIHLMEDILLIPNYLPDVRARKIVRFRTLLHPITGRNLCNWTFLAKKFETSRFLIKNEYEKSIERLTKLTPPSLLTRIQSRFDTEILDSLSYAAKA